jgi:hypothetical protein
VALISTGLGQIFPYRIRQADQFGNPTTTVLNIEDIDTLKANVSGNNVVLPTASFGTTATLPDGSPGNQYLLLRFTHKLKIDSILSNELANQPNSGLTTAVSLLAYNPNTEATTVLRGKGFVGGMTYYNRGIVNNTLGDPVVAAELDANGNVVWVAPEAQGFPGAISQSESAAGTGSSFTGAADLVDPKSFVFVADTDDNLNTFETFPSDVLIRLVVTNAVRDSDNKVLSHEVCSATTVGADPAPPDVLGLISGSNLEIAPGNGASNVDPTTSVVIRFNKPVQPGDMGTFFNPQNLTPSSGGVTLQVTNAASTYPVIYYADPLGFGDFCTYVVQPAYTLQGQSPVQVSVNEKSVRGLIAPELGSTASTDFTTGDGPGIVNAPVAPEAIYIGMGGSRPGLSVIDLNGFGQGTGDIDNTRFPLNPNVGAPGLFPPLQPGSSNLDAGSAGLFTLTQDTRGETRLIRDPQVAQINDIHIGAPLDLVFNNQNVNRNSNRANQVTLNGVAMPGNSITVPPHPNPPRLVFPPPNPTRSIFGEEPTTASSQGQALAANVLTTSPPCMASPPNALAVGNPFATEVGQVGLIAANLPGVFYGPQPPPPSPPPPLSFCPFTARQQIGHFLYVLDRDNRQLLVVNSNRMTVLDTIRLSDPVDMAVSPRLTQLAVTNFASASVTFLDINPLSPTFHQVLGEARVDPGPTAVVYQPDGEDVLVVSRAANTVSLLSPRDFSVRKVVAGFVSDPVDVVVTERYQVSGIASGVYYAYILNANGSVAIYESGPTGTNGIGFDEIIGLVPDISFARARKLIRDPASTTGAVLVAHVDEAGLGQVSRLELTSAIPGPLPINQNQAGFIIPPWFRQKTWTVVQRFGGLSATTPVKDLFSGNSIVDITTDELTNNGAFPPQVTPYNGGVADGPLGPFGGHSSKSAVMATTGGVVPAFTPRYLFAALADVGKVDVFEIGSGKRVASIDAPGVQVVASYWRQ